MFHRRPVALERVPPAASVSLARLSGLEGLARALLVSIAPLLALETLGSKAAVSHVYLAASLLTMAVTLNVARLERLIARRFVVSLAAVFLVCAAFALFFGETVLFALGIGMRSAAASMFSVCMSLYIMDWIGKRDLPRNESRRMVYVGVAWTVGPSAGLWLWNHAPPGSPFVTSALVALGMLAYFWYLRMGDNPVVRPALSRAASPIAAVRRYMGQPRLRIAYGITLSRSCYWVALFIFGPIYVIEAGLPVTAAGLLLSGVSVMLLASPVVRRAAERFGTRQVIISGLLVTGASMLGLAVIGTPHPAGIGLWITGAVGGVMLDVLGNIPFMRNVRPRERGDMTVVFSTWREVSELLTPGIAAAVLLVGPFWLLYAVLAIMHGLAAAGAARLPRRL